MKQQRIAMLEMLVCATLWSIAGIFIKFIPWNPFVIAGLRSLFSAGTVLVYMALTRQKIFFNKRVAKSMFFLAATFLCFVTANKMTTAANAIVLQFTAPVFILLFSALLYKKRFSRLDLGTVVLTLGGISLFMLDGLGRGHTVGNLIALCAGLFMAGMYISVGTSQGAERMNGLLFGHLLTFAAGLPFLIGTRPVFTPSSVGAILILGVVQLGIPYILLALASAHCPPLACSLISAAEPLLNPVWVALFAREYPSPLSLLGGAVVVATITLWCVVKDRQKKLNPA